eukprot:scaffold10253_cov124-Isochrysis_galbana.AAC.12
MPAAPSRPPPPGSEGASRALAATPLAPAATTPPIAPALAPAGAPPSSPSPPAQDLRLSSLVPTAASASAGGVGREWVALPAVVTTSPAPPMSMAPCRSAPMRREAESKGLPAICSLLLHGTGGRALACRNVRVCVG